MLSIQQWMRTTAQLSRSPFSLSLDLPLPPAQPSLTCAPSASLRSAGQSAPLTETDGDGTAKRFEFGPPPAQHNQRINV